MLGKLFKHEMKAMSRLLLPLYLVLAVLTIVDRIVIYMELFKGYFKIIPGFITFAYILSIVGIIIVSSVIIIVRFYKNLMTDEGYLMFTLPVKSYQHINSKLLASFLWTLVSFATVILSLWIVFSGSPYYDLVPEIWNKLISEFKSEFGSHTALFVTEFIILIIIGTVNKILMIYVSIALGQFIQGHKILGSFAAFIGISTIIQVFTTVVTFISTILFKNTLNDVTLLPLVIFPFIILFTLVLNVVYYWLTDLIFRNKLNLD